MLNFLRKIRLNLWRENRFTKYLLYAIGEIALVVIGILIALQVSNENQQNQLDQQFLDDLQYVLADLEQDKTQLNLLQKQRGTAIHYAQTLIEAYLDKRPVSMDTLFNGIRHITLERRFLRNDVGLSKIESSKRYQSKEFLELKSMLEDYIELTNYFTYIEERLNIFIENHEFKLSENGEYTPLYEELYYVKKGTSTTDALTPNARWINWVIESASFKAILLRLEDDLTDKILPAYTKAETEIDALEEAIRAFLIANNK